jgi:hypothetical protein
MQQAGYLKIPLYRRDGVLVASATISSADATLILPHRWHRDSAGYARRNDAPGIMMHRVVLGLETHDGHHSDHINGDPLDNRRENLRVVTHTQNMQNRKAPSHGRSPFRNVQWETAKRRWRVRCRIEGTVVSLGYFDDEVEAALVAHAYRESHMPLARPDPELVRRGLIPGPDLAP